jgi:hypothetical protein
MVALNISDELALAIKEEATKRGLSVEEYLRFAVKRERTLAARQKMEQEQAWWLALPLRERAKYEGEFIAVHDQKVIDHDKDETTLHKRIRKAYGKTPVLVMPAEGPKEIHLYTPRIVRQ